MRTTTNEKLQQLQNLHNESHALSIKLLEDIKSNLTQIQQLCSAFRGEEPDLVYRFYHQSFKVYAAVTLIEQAKALFVRLAPNGIPLNDWYCSIADRALSKKFDAAATNQIWLEETQPLLEAMWHSKYFLEQMIVAAADLEAAPQTLPSGWAAVLYLYNLR